jgi:hypothetical protein
MQKKNTKNKINKVVVAPATSMWDMLVYLIKNVPWWIVKTIDWIYTLITAIIIKLVSR